MIIVNILGNKDKKKYWIQNWKRISISNEWISTKFESEKEIIGNVAINNEFHSIHEVRFKIRKVSTPTENKKLKSLVYRFKLFSHFLHRVEESIPLKSSNCPLVMYVYITYFADRYRWLSDEKKLNTLF